MRGCYGKGRGWTRSVPSGRWSGACERGCGGFHQPVSCLRDGTGSTPALPHLPHHARPAAFTPKMLSCPVPPLFQPHSGWSEHSPSTQPACPGLLGHWAPVTQGMAFLLPCHTDAPIPVGIVQTREHPSRGCRELWQGLASGAGIEGTGKRLRAMATSPAEPRPEAGHGPGGCRTGEGWQCHSSAWHQIKEKCQNGIQPLALKSFIKRLIALRAKLEAD